MAEKTAEELKIEGKGEGKEAEVPEEERVTPDVEADFLGILKDYGVAEKAAKIITKHIAETGTADIFEDPRQLLGKMAKFPRHVPPVTRKNILDHWTSTRNIPVPEGFEEEVKLTDEQLKARKEKEIAPEKYTVDTDTGAIKVASTSDKALTWAEAEKLSMDIVARAKRAGGDEPIFVLGETGAWTLNPKAKVGTAEFAVFQMYQDSLRKGEPIDPVEELTRREEQMARLKDAMGVKGESEDSEITLLERLGKLGMLRKGEDEGGLLAQLAALGLLRQVGEGGGSSQIDILTQLNALGLLKTPGGDDSRITAVMEEVKSLREALQKSEVDNLKSMVTSLSNSLSEWRKEVANGGRLEGRYALMEKTIGTIDAQLSGIRSDAKPLLASIGGGGGGSGSTMRSPEEKAKVARGLKEAIALEQEAKELEDELLFGGKQG